MVRYDCLFEGRIIAANIRYRASGTHMHTQTHTHTHTHTYTLTHLRTHTHTHTLSCLGPRSNSLIKYPIIHSSKERLAATCGSQRGTWCGRTRFEECRAERTQTRRAQTRRAAFAVTDGFLFKRSKRASFGHTHTEKAQKNRDDFRRSAL